MFWPAICGTTDTVQSARHNPATPAITLTNVLSSTNNRTMPILAAPTAMRRAISRRRPVKRTSNKFATLLHAISNTALTAASSVMKAGRNFPVTSSAAGISTDVQLLSAVSGC
jgi:hypothetical protein